MNIILSYAILIASIFCSFRLAKEQNQNAIVWPVITALMGPLVFIIQYLVTTFTKKTKVIE